MESWKQIPGWVDYRISDLGRLKSRRPVGGKRKGWRILKGGQDKDGYRRAVLTREGPKRKSLRIAHLVALTFLGPKPDGSVLTHLNGKNTDNRVSNLAWRTQKENMRDKLRHGTSQRGENHPGVKLTEADVRAIRKASDTYARIAESFGVSRATIGAIKTNRNWGWLA